MKRLAKMIATRSIPHALLFAGSKVDQIAYQFAGDLVSNKRANVRNHPDIHLYFPEGKIGMHAIETLRQLTQEIILSPFEAAWKVFIIHEAQRMLPTSSNALLKIFEEPPRQSVIILLAPSAKNILPTVLSRCQTLYFQNVESTITPLQKQFLAFFLQPKLDDDQLDKIVVQVEEENELAIERYEKEIEGAFTINFLEKASTLLEALLLWYRDRTLLELEGGERYLTFPENMEQLKQTPLIPIERVERVIVQSRLALERSMKLATCLKALFYQLKV